NEGGNSGGNKTKSTPQSPKEKYHVNGKEIEIVREKVLYLGMDGKMITESLTDYTRKNILEKFPNLNDFILRWNKSERKTAVIDEMAANGIFIDEIRKQYPQFNEMDVFDLVCHLAFDTKVITRKERVRKVKDSGYLKKYKDDALRVIEGLLDKYADNGIIDFEKLETLKLAPFSQIGNEIKILKLFNGKKGFEDTIKEIENIIYVA
ncbi:MAG: restriction endonuclease subunit R, partial [Bacteroidales bacterium]|nr:restriction endonuclease subunit R [Bacteroidales bacterium]